MEILIMYFSQDQKAFAKRLFKLFDKYNVKYILYSYEPRVEYTYKFGDEQEIFGEIVFFIDGNINLIFKNKCLFASFLNIPRKPNFKKKACYLGKYISKRIINDCLE